MCGLRYLKLQWLAFPLPTLFTRKGLPTNMEKFTLNLFLNFIFHIFDKHCSLT
jgi:hypothetical protein